MDACDEIMLKVKKPTGLIAYTPSTLQAYLRPRVLAYCFLILVCAVGLAVSLARHEAFAAVLLRATDSPYQLLPDGRIMNHFKLHLHNQGHQTEEFRLATESKDVELTQPAQSHILTSGESREVHLFAIFSAVTLDKSGSSFNIKVSELTTGLSKNFNSTLIGPH